MGTLGHSCHLLSHLKTFLRPLNESLSAFYILWNSLNISILYECEICLHMDGIHATQWRIWCRNGISKLRENETLNAFYLDQPVFKIQAFKLFRTYSPGWMFKNRQEGNNRCFRIQTCFMLAFWTLAGWNKSYCPIFSLFPALWDQYCFDLL